MNEKQARCLGRIEAMVAELHKKLPTVEKRVGSLERSRSYAKGATVVFAAAVAAIWKAFNG